MVGVVVVVMVVVMVLEVVVMAVVVVIYLVIIDSGYSFLLSVRPKVKNAMFKKKYFIKICIWKCCLVIPNLLSRFLYAEDIQHCLPQNQRRELTKYNNGTIVAYRQTSNISHILIGNRIFDHSDVVGALPAGAAPTTFSFAT